MRPNTILALALAIMAIAMPASNVIVRRSTAETTAIDGANRAPHTARDAVAARVRADVDAMQTFRPGYRFWRHVFTIPDGSIAFGSAADGRLLATFPAKGSIQRSPTHSKAGRLRANWRSEESRSRSSWNAPPGRCSTTRPAEMRSA
jgi:hypothetical protein